MSRKLSSDEVAALGLDSGGGDAPEEPPAGARKLAPNEVQALGLDAPRIGPYRDNPTFSTAPTPAGVPVLPPREAVPPARPQHAQSEAALNGVLSGASLGFDDEAGGILDALGHRMPMSDNPEFGGVPGTLGEAEKERAQQPQRSFGDDYRAARDQIRQNKAETRADWPKTTVAAEIAGGALTGGAGAGRSAGTRIARAAVEGAASGLGNSDADVTRGDVGGALKDTAKGLLAGAAAGTAAEGGRALVRGARDIIRNRGALPADELRARVLNEVAEGTSKTTPTARKQLDLAGDAIVKEVVHGPEGDAIRAAYLGSAKKGTKTVAAAADRITKENNAAYDAFKAAGKDRVDAKAFQGALQSQANKARAAGKSTLADAIEKYGEHVVEEGEKAGGLTLTQLRGLTSEAQTKVAGMLGGLNDRSLARKVGKQVVRVITPAMKETLRAAAAGEPALQRAAETIEGNNQRLQALIQIGGGLEQRVYKDASQPPLTVRVARSIKQSPTGALIGGAAEVAANKIERVRTTRAINAARRLSEPPAEVPAFLSTPAERFMGTVGRMGARAAVAKDEDEANP